MAKVLSLVSGWPKMVEESGSPTIYSEAYTASGAVTEGTPVTLPSSKTYDSSELQVYFSGFRLMPGIDFEYEGTAPRTQVSFNFDLISGEKVHFYIDRNI